MSDDAGSSQKAEKSADAFRTISEVSHGLDWEFSKERITEKDFSYLDPTGVPLDNGTYLLVMSGATNEMADPMKNPNYQLFTAQLILP